MFRFACLALFVSSMSGTAVWAQSRPSIPFTPVRSADPGGYKTQYPANYGPGTSKSGPSGQRLYVHPGSYLPSTGSSATGSGSNGTRGRSTFGYDESRPKTLAPGR